MGDNLHYRVQNLATGQVTFYNTVADVIAGIPIQDEEEQAYVQVLLGENAYTEVEDPNERRFSVTIVRRDVDGDEEMVGGRKSSRKRQMRTRKHGGRRHHKTVKRTVGRYMEAPRSRSVFQMEGARRRRVTRRR